MLFGGSYGKSQIKCPRCQHIGGWYKYKCFNCGYIRKINEQLRNQIVYFFAPQQYGPKILYCDKSGIPEARGVYGWYFDTDLKQCFSQGNYNTISIGPINFRYLLYIGIAGEKGGTRTLRNRIIDDHLNQNSEGSSFRQSLAALLWRELDLYPSKQLNGNEEKSKLNEWIFDHCRVAWFETNEPELVEKVMLAEFGSRLVLNLKDNKQNPCKKELEKLRKEWRKLGR